MTEQERLETLTDKLDIYQRVATSIRSDLFGCKAFLTTLENDGDLTDQTPRNLAVDMKMLFHYLDEAETLSANMVGQLWSLREKANKRLTE